MSTRKALLEVVSVFSIMFRCFGNVVFAYFSMILFVSVESAFVHRYTHLFTCCTYPWGNHNGSE